jgi:ATP synthase protein I
MQFDWKKAAVLSQIAYSFPAAVLTASFLGWLLDKYLGSGPWLLFFGFILGLAAGFANVFRVLASQKED